MTNKEHVDFEKYLLANNKTELDAMCDMHYKEEAFQTMLETHMKTDDNSYLTIEDNQVDLYKLAYSEGYKAGYRRAMNIASVAWINSKKKDGGDIKFGKF